MAMQDILQYQERVTNALELYLKTLNQRDTSNKWYGDVILRLEQFSTSGKLLRGSLVCFMHDAFGGSHSEEAYRTAVVLELVHSGLLIHDDIIDRDVLRRGRPAIHVQYQALAKTSDAAHFGESMAICAADTTYFLALEHLGELHIPPAQRHALYSLLNQVLATVCAGQMLDIELGHSVGAVKKKDILTVMEQKTALYSVALPLAAGALLAEQSAKTVDTIMKLGTLIGLIFQIRDDELAIFGDSRVTGKPVGSDIKEGKKTLLYYYLMRSSTDSEKARLLQIFGNLTADPADIDYVRQAMIRHKVPAIVKQEVESLTTRAAKLIGQVPLQKSAQASLRELLDFCAKREV